MAEHVGPLADLTVIIVLGIAAQWVSWRLRWPAILVLLMFGFLAGPLARWVAPAGWAYELLHVDPDGLFGQELLRSIVSLSVAIILFEGGMTLRLRELEHRGVVLRLILIGVAVTWAASAWGARALTGLSWPLAILLGAILVVTGPTVILPLLRHTRLRGRVGPVLKWEGILIDPVGAVLAVLVFEAILAERVGVGGAVWTGLLKAAVGGSLIGAAGAVALVPLLRRYWIPDYLQSPVTLALVMAVFTAANRLQAESGLLAVTLMGAVLANQRWADVKHIAQFKEVLRVLLISVLFIILAARLRLEDVAALGWGSVVLVGWLIVVVRPAAVLLSTVGSGLSWRERLFLSLVAPRGIVAAAVASAFALQLSNAGVTAAEQLVPLMFVVIVGTIAFSGLTAGPAARLLGIVESRHEGYLIVGAHPAAREIGRALQDQGAKVLLVDGNWSRVRRARMMDLPARLGNIASPDIMDELDLEGIGRLLALTANDEANSLAVMRFREVFEQSDMYQLPPEDAQVHRADRKGHVQVGGRYLFDPKLTYFRLLQTIYRGGTIKATKLTEQFDWEAFRSKYGDRAVPLFYVAESGDVLPFTAERPPKPEPGQTLISLLEAGAERQKLPAEAEGAARREGGSENE